MIEVAPGQWKPVDPDAQIPSVTMAYWSPNDDGTWKLIPFKDHLVRLNSTLARALGFPGQYNTLLRLAAAGFVEIVRAAPGTSLLNLDSWFNHLRRCAEDPDFWKDPKRLKVYKDTFGL